MAKILIVDDEPRIRDLIREHLQYAGFVCEEAGDGGAALAVLAQGGIDLVILDIMMPGQDGLELCRRLRGGPSPLSQPSERTVNCLDLCSQAGGGFSPHGGGAFGAAALGGQYGQPARHTRAASAGAVRGV